MQTVMVRYSAADRALLFVMSSPQRSVGQLSVARL